MNTPEPVSPPVRPTQALLEQRVTALVAHFRQVQAERMQGIPLLNPALQVEAVGFEWAAAPDAEAATVHGRLAVPVAEGVLITPWFMSLLRLPAQALPHGNRVGHKTVRDFGTERFDFIGAHDPAVGYHESCALFSPMQGFTDQALARETAQAALALMRPPAPAASATAAAAPLPTAVPARRAFLMGRPAAAGSAA